MLRVAVISTLLIAALKRSAQGTQTHFSLLQATRCSDDSCFSFAKFQSHLKYIDYNHASFLIGSPLLCVYPDAMRDSTSADNCLEQGILDNRTSTACKEEPALAMAKYFIQSTQSVSDQIHRSRESLSLLHCRPSFPPTSIALCCLVRVRAVK